MDEEYMLTQTIRTSTDWAILKNAYEKRAVIKKQKNDIEGAEMDEAAAKQMFQE